MTGSGTWWGRYDRKHFWADQGEGRAARPEQLRPLGHVRRRPLVLGDRQGPAAADRDPDRHRPDRRRRRVARSRPALFGRLGPILRASLFLPPDRVDRRRPAGDDRHFDDAARPGQAPVARRRGLLLRPAGVRAGPRTRGERRDALDRHRRRPDSAVRVPQALLRRRHGLAPVAARAGQVAAGLLAFGGASPAPSPSC